MSRTYRCKKSVPTGLTVRDGSKWFAYDCDNKSYIEGNAWKTRIAYRHNLFGLKNTELIESINSSWDKGRSIVRFAPQWTKKPNYDFESWGFTKRTRSRRRRRIAKHAISKGDYSYAMWD